MLMMEKEHMMMVMMMMMMMMIRPYIPCLGHGTCMFGCLALLGHDFGCFVPRLTQTTHVR